MNDLKRIGNAGRAMMRALASQLGIEGVNQRAPISLDTSRLVPVVSLPLMVAEKHAFMDLTNHTIGALDDYAYMFYGPLTATVDEAAAPAKLPDWTGREHWVRGFRFVLTYDAAGALADEAKFMKVTVEVRTTGGTPDDIQQVIEYRFGVYRQFLTYPVVFPSGRFLNVMYGATYEMSPFLKGWDGYVPPGYQVAIRIERDGGGVFPANTTIHGNVWVSQGGEGVITNGR